jgi:hypothetical protein
MLGDKAVPVAGEIAKLPNEGPKELGRFGGYVARLLEKLHADLNPWCGAVPVSYSSCASF